MRKARAKDPETATQAPWVVSREDRKEQGPRGRGLGRPDLDDAKGEDIG